MPKIIVTSRYVKPNAHKKFGNYIKYIATREGVEKPVPKQESNQELDREIFMNYLDSRPNSHGLFSEKGTPIVLDKAAKEVASHSGAIWTHIVSLKREDAERMGYIDLEHWRDLVRRHVTDMAAANKIAPDNFRWYAAFHNKETNPHVHIVVYSANPKEGYLTKEGIEKIRSAFANDIYRDELQNLYQQQTVVRDKLRSEAENVMTDLLSELQNNSEFDPQLEQLILKLQSQLKNSKGKKVYGYLQPNVKKTVDQIIAELAGNPILKNMYAEWCSLEQQKYETYTNAVQKFPTLEENKVFKPIKNEVIQAVLDMDFSEQDIIVTNDEILFREDLEDAVPYEDMSGDDFHMNWRGDYRTAKEFLKDKQYEKAFELFQSEAQKNNILAIYSIAKMYQDGLLGKENISKAQKYFAETLKGFLFLEPSAGKMQPYIWYHLGRLYNFGYGTEQNCSEAFKWFQKAALAGNDYAQYSLGSLYFYGNGTQQDYSKAFSWYKKSADLGNIFACYSAAKMLDEGIGTEKNTEQAELYFKNAYQGFRKIKDEKPDDKILFRLGMMTLNGQGCKADRNLGMDFIKQSSMLGNEYAKVFLENTDRYNMTVVRNAVISMLFSFGRLISYDYSRSLRGQNMRAEHKLKSAIRRKKQALGLKESLTEQKF